MFELGDTWSLGNSCGGYLNCLVNYRWGKIVEVWLHSFLTSALVRDESSAARGSLFTPGEASGCTHAVGGLVGPQSFWTPGRREKYVTYTEESNRDSSVVLSVVVSVYGRIFLSYFVVYLTVWRRNYFFNFSTPCI